MTHRTLLTRASKHIGVRRRKYNYLGLRFQTQPNFYLPDPLYKQETKLCSKLRVFPWVNPGHPWEYL